MYMLKASQPRVEVIVTDSQQQKIANTFGN